MRVVPREEVYPVPEDSLNVNVPGLFCLAETSFPVKPKRSERIAEVPERKRRRQHMKQIVGIQEKDTRTVDELAALER